MKSSAMAPKAQGNLMAADASRIRGQFTTLGGEAFYRIRNYDAMPPFFMTLVSDVDHWLFVSSNGCLTAGRKNSGHALFPYYTEDKIHDMVEVTGPKTIFRVERDGEKVLWEPFSERYRGLYRIERNLYKSEAGNKILFEEINRDLALSFAYMWKFSDEFGFVRESRLESLSRQIINLDMVDGLQNVLPSGVHPDFQLYFSSLGDAYKKSELEGKCNLGLFSLSSVPGDKAEPMESLKANTCFGIGLTEPVVLLSSRQLNCFRSGQRLASERDVRGARGAYFVSASFKLEPESREQWILAADVNKGPSDVVNLLQKISHADLQEKIEADVAKGSARLRKIVGSADGLQKTRDVIGSTHHFANCLFNVMRGGIFQEGYAIDKQDLSDTLKRFNKDVFAAHQDWLASLPTELTLSELHRRLESRQDANLERIIREYLPLSFSRRHGDPSRPWNIFSIDLKDARGHRVLAYQGNWRDIFQNWEALGLSFPEYVEGFIGKFLNTTTADGYNPYRIGKFGFDWEKPHPNEPWAHIGYWGDHQLIYLLRLLEWSRKLHPGRLEELMRKETFVYADVPYDIKPYDDLVKNPKNTIDYNKAREKAVEERVTRVGLDGQYVVNAKGAIHTANLAEKLLVPLLAKVSNFIPGAGIWLNTQRPEWNDANNALAGFGLSMVTLYYARRYAAFMQDLLDAAPKGKIVLSREVGIWFLKTLAALEDFSKDYFEEAAQTDARLLVEPMGRAAEEYRKNIYQNSFSGDTTALEKDRLSRFLELLIEYIDKAFRLNRRKDGLYHSYNVFNPNTMEVRTLYEMLEGQVAVLSSGALDPAEAISVLEGLRTSRMYRADQHSYLLYPDKDLPRFTEKNVIPFSALSKLDLVRRLVAEEETSVIEADITGTLHFNGDLKNADDLAKALSNLKARGYAELVEKDHAELIRLFEKVFDHQSFTGRSGTFFGYEGLGSIYWHMVSKLLLAVQENFFVALDARKTVEAERLKEIYFDVRSGISFNKSPEVYGAFPSDPYSHTPAGAGAKQPGMTGQVKEEVITRAGELGVRIREGAVVFQPVLLRREEFLDEPAAFEFINVEGECETLALAPETLGFTVCQVPIVYHLSDRSRFEITFRDGMSSTANELALDRETSAGVFARSGKVARIDAYIPRSMLI